MTCPRPPLFLNGYVSIDEGPVVAGDFLSHARVRYPQAGSHISRAKAFENAFKVAGAVDVNIVGHGLVGLLGTGCGEIHNHAPETRLDLQGEPNWEIPSTISARSLTLIGCSTGAGPEGAALLHRLAQRTGLEVRAPAGLVKIDNGCPDLYLGRDVEWQIARPDEPEPRPIDPPGLFVADFDVRHILMVFEENFRLLNRASVEVARFQDSTVSIYEARASDTAFARTWEREAAQHASSFFEFQVPQLSGHPAAFVTGLLELSLHVDGRRHRRRFRVFNDELIQDMTTPQVYYRANVRAMLDAMPA